MRRSAGFDSCFIPRASTRCVYRESSFCLLGRGESLPSTHYDARAIEALITDYFNEGLSDDDESDHRNDGKNFGNPRVKFEDIVRRSEEQQRVVRL